MDASPGFESHYENAAETLQLLFQVLNGDSSAIEQVDPYLSQRSAWRTTQQVHSFAAPQASRSSQVDTPETGSPRRPPGSRHDRSPPAVSFARADIGYKTAPHGFGTPAPGSESRLKSSEMRRPQDGESFAREVAPRRLEHTPSSGNFRYSREPVDFNDSGGFKKSAPPGGGPTSLQRTGSDISNGKMRAREEIHGFTEPHFFKSRAPAPLSHSSSLANLQPSAAAASMGSDRRMHSRAGSRNGTPNTLQGTREIQTMKATGTSLRSGNASSSRRLKAVGAASLSSNSTSISLHQSMSGRPSSRQLALSSSMPSLAAADVNPLEAHISSVSAAQKTAAMASSHAAEEAEMLAAAARAAANRSNYLADLSDAAREAAHSAAVAKQATDKYNEMVTMMPPGTMTRMSESTLVQLEAPAQLQGPMTNVNSSAPSRKPAIQQQRDTAVEDEPAPPAPPAPAPPAPAAPAPAAPAPAAPPAPPAPSTKPATQQQEDAAAEDDSSSGASDMDNSEDEDDSDDGADADELENEADVADRTVEHGVLLKQPVTLPVFQLLIGKLDMNEEEGGNIYDDKCQELAQKGIKIDASGIPLEEFLDDLHIEPKDDEGIQHLLNMFKEAKEAPPSRNPRQAVTPGGKQAIHRSLFDKLARWKEWYNPPDDIPKLLEAATGFLSRAEYHMLESFALMPQELTKIIDRQMVDPPLMNSAAGQASCKEICTRKVTEIINACKASGTKFTDPEWDVRSAPTSVLYVDEQCPGYDCTVAEPANYKRLTAITKQSKSGLSMMFGGFGGGAKRHSLKPIVFKGTVAAGDVIQGQIGTCFLLGAIGAIASQREDSFEKIFVKYDVDVGVYGVRFCVDGEWTSVIVDDWMPVDYNGQLLYARCKDPQEVWVPVLEKAFCKLHSCYEMCDGGHSTEAIITFFGGVAGYLKIQEKHRKNPKQYFKLLRNAFNKGWLLTTSFVHVPGNKGGQGQGKCGEDMLPCGLVGGHAYSVLDFAEACGNHLICCRNPWGSGEWTGKWSDGNTFGEWTEEMIAAANFAKRDDGKFWMSIEDFVMNSGGVDYARTFGPNWKKVTHYAHFQSQVFEATAKRKWKGRRRGQLSFAKGDQIHVETLDAEWWSGKQKNGTASGVFPGRFVRLNSRSILRFDITAIPVEGSKEPVKMIIMLMQQNVMLKRKFVQLENGLNYKDTSYPQIGMVVLNPDGEVHVQKKRHSRCVWAEVTCPGGGLWRVYAYSAAGTGAACLLRTYIKGGTLTFKEVPDTQFEEIASFMTK